MELKERVSRAFLKHFGTPPEFIVRAPGRVNLIGEHTDYNDGFALPMAIDRAVWIALRPRDDRRVFIRSLEQPEPTDFVLGDIQHTDAGWSEYVKGMAVMLQNGDYKLTGWEGVLSSDVPVGSGLSSSAALEMGVGCAFSIVSGFPFDGVDMARLGQKNENEWVGANTGIMDQLISAVGLADHALLIDCRSLETRAVPLPTETTVVILDTKSRRGLVDSAYNERRAQCEAAARFFGVPALRDVAPEQFQRQAADLDELTRRRARHVITENARVLAAVDALAQNDPLDLGRLMIASHASLRDDFEVTNAALNEIVECALAQPGCYGARMTGAGFGGCAVALVRAEAVESFTMTVTDCYQTATELTPAIYVCAATNGAEAIIDAN